MKVPDLRRQPGWQRFFAGIAIGGCISWVIFLYMYGVMQERTSRLIADQQKQLKELRGYVEIWQEDYQELNKRNQEMLLIQAIHVKVANGKRYGITDSKSLSSVEEAVKDDLKSLMTKDLTTVYKNREFIVKTVENKTMNINGRRYRLHVKEVGYFTTLSLIIELRLAD